MTLVSVFNEINAIYLKPQRRQWKWDSVASFPIDISKNNDEICQYCANINGQRHICLFMNLLNAAVLHIVEDDLYICIHLF